MLTPSLSQVIQEAAEKEAGYLAVALPGTVVSYNATSRTATVRVGVHRIVPDFNDPTEELVEELPPLQNVPVCWLVGRNIHLADPGLGEGDSVLLIAMDRDIAGWRRTGAPAEPDDYRTHSWASAVAIPGLVPNTSPFSAPTDAAALSSALDLLVGVLKAATASDNPAVGWPALKAAVAAAFPSIPTPTISPSPPVFVPTTTGSDVLKLRS